jgi:hypothetical protein
LGRLLARTQVFERDMDVVDRACDLADVLSLPARALLYDGFYQCPPLLEHRNRVDFHFEVVNLSRNIGERSVPASQTAELPVSRIVLVFMRYAGPKCPF